VEATNHSPKPLKGLLSLNSTIFPSVQLYLSLNYKKTKPMKNVKTLIIGSIIGLSGFAAMSQAPTLPAASPAASVSQTFGITKVDIDYSSPGVKGRTIWGDLVPYDSVWRTGANSCTTISFSTDVIVGGQKVKQGKYGLFTIPGRNSWTIIINSDATQWGSYSYKKLLDVARFTVTPQMGDMKERLGFMIDPVSDSIGRVTLCWEKIKVSFDVMARTNAMVEKGFDNMWRVYTNAANYYVDNHFDLTKAHDWAMMSVNMKEHFYNRYVMARVLQAQGNKNDALKYATDAKTLGEKANDDFYAEYKDRVAKLIVDLGGGK
jgi:hypothetical protein